jgi:DNA-binding SARP family transcriptional activator/tetratricopeptide (TPR) repeat protein
MEFGMLGSLQVLADDGNEPVVVSAARLRALLAVLLWRANQPVPIDELSELVWDGAPPGDPAGAARVLVMRLRRALGPQVGARIMTRAPGYMIELSGDELDASRFEKLVQDVGAASGVGRWADAAQTAAQALGLWRGTPLADISSQALRDRWVPHLEQLRVQALEWRIEADLHEGRQGQLISELRDLTGRHPLREPFHAQLMLALARAGRRAEALEAYRQARRLLVDELGIEPGPNLRHLHERVLSGDADMVTPSPEPTQPPPASAASRIPRQLPPTTGFFVGRRAETDALCGLVKHAAKPAQAEGTVVIWAINGIAGVGKTALALRAAHQLDRNFPDGQLFIDMHGYPEGSEPRSAGEALDCFLRALGIPPQQVPRDTEERAALLRARLAGTRTLILVDNAASESQVRPLLPGNDRCLVLVTSRRRLKGLEAAHLLCLDVLPPTDAMALVRAVAGRERVAADDPVLAEIAELCGRLPLALRIAAALLRRRAAWTPEHLARLLREHKHRVTALPDSERDLGAALDLSYQSLTGAHQRLFRGLGLIASAGFDSHTAAALVGTDPATVARLLEDLVGHSLLGQHAPGRYRLHDLIRLYARSLCAQDPEPDREAGRADTVIAPEPRPNPMPLQLPGTVRHFVGREHELAELTRILDQAEQEPGAVAIIVIAGTPGVGKTALAVRWAHQAARRFPEGQLYVNLRGYDPGRPVAPSDALAGLLSALGVRGEDIPAEADERAARYRSLLAGRRMLVVLDNARSVEQVRPLLPGTGTCMTVVTGRDSLAGLVARDGAVRLDLDVLPLGDAISLLRMLIGGRVPGEPAAAAQLAAQCSRLPLTLRVAAELAAARPAAPLADLVSELSDWQRRLDRLDAGGDPRSSARTVFSWSCQRLDASAARAFRMASVHPGPDMDRYALAALTATTAEQSRRMLEVLEQAHLIQPTRPGRYSMHDLLRAYASELAARTETPGQRQAAVTRLFDYYLHTAASATDTLMPAERYRRRRLPQPTTAPRPMRSPSASQGWLDTERVNLVAIVTQAATSGWPGHATGLSATLSRYLETGGHAAEALIIHGHARDAARRTGDGAAEAVALTSLAMVDWRQGRFQQAAARLRHALALFGRAGDQTGAARASANLGMIDGQQGRYRDAARHLRHALAVFRQAGDQTGAARALINLGMIDDQQGRYQRATNHYQEALALFRAAGDRSGEAYALGNLGITYRRQGRYQRAADYFQHAMAVYGETGSRSGRAQLSAAMGDLALQQGRPDPASDHFQRALALCRETGDQSGEATALNGLGEATLWTGKPEHARAHYAAALDLTSQIGEKYQQARAHDGLARSQNAAGNRCYARYHWQQALVLYEKLAAPEADQVRQKLAACPGSGQSSTHQLAADGQPAEQAEHGEGVRGQPRASPASMLARPGSGHRADGVAEEHGGDAHGGEP